MKCAVMTVVTLGVLQSWALAQEFIITGQTFGVAEPLYQYDDREPWKHGWIQVMPYYGGYHSFRPYNYKHVLSQSAQAAAWGLPHTMPYSQQFYHRYENFADSELSVPVLQSQSGPHPSAMDQPHGNTRRQSPLISADFDHRQGAAYPRSIAPVNFHRIHQSPASAPEAHRQSLQNVQLQQLLHAAEAQNGPTLYEPIPAPAATPQ